MAKNETARQSVSPGQRIVEIEVQKSRLDTELSEILQTIDVGQTFIINNIPHKVCKGRGETGKRFLRRMISDETLALMNGSKESNQPSA